MESLYTTHLFTVLFQQSGMSGMKPFQLQQRSNASLSRQTRAPCMQRLGSRHVNVQSCLRCTQEQLIPRWPMQRQLPLPPLHSVEERGSGNAETSSSSNSSSSSSSATTTTTSGEQVDQAAGEVHWATASQEQQAPCGDEAAEESQGVRWVSLHLFPTSHHQPEPDSYPSLPLFCFFCKQGGTGDAQSLQGSHFAAAAALLPLPAHLLHICHGCV